MAQFVYNSIEDSCYLGILTVLDYELPVDACLSQFVVNLIERNERKIIVDLALKVGINQYRFLSYSVLENGTILLASFKYVSPSKKIVKKANSFIKENKDLFSYSVLSTKSINQLMTNI